MAPKLCGKSPWVLATRPSFSAILYSGGRLFTMYRERRSRELVALLDENGFDVITHETSDGAGWGSWRARTDQVLEGLIPSER